MSDFNQNNLAVERAFSKQSSSFDDFEKDNPILIWMRHQIHNHCMKYFKAGEKLLELNCGTGIDAIYFAEHDLQVFATDLSEGMLGQLRKKISEKNLAKKITVQQCSYENMSQLAIGNWQLAVTSTSNFQPPTFDHIFSDFGGLNCAQDLKKVIAQFDALLKRGGTVTLVIMPKVCPWEILLAIKGNFKIAFRRLKKNGSISHLEGENFTTYYYTPSQVIKMFNKNFKKISLEGLASVSPPPYLYEWAKREPKLYKRLTRIDEKLCSIFPFNCWADHFILTMKKED